MRLFHVVIFAALTFAALPAAAQDGAPMPLMSAGGVPYQPEGYVPLPGQPALEDIVYDPDAVIAAPLAAAEMPPAPVKTDPMAVCTELAGVDYKGDVNNGALDDCLEKRHGESVATLESTAVDAHARIDNDDKAAVRALAASNLSFGAFRDSECLRQHDEMGADKTAARQVEWACRTIMNEMRSEMLRNQ